MFTAISTELLEHLSTVVCIYVHTHTHTTYCDIRNLSFAEHADRPTVYGVGLRPLTYWDCGFESRHGHRRLSLASVMCCQVEVSVSG
jgi:hypothetical protein